jgi:hypothetical protein
MAVEEDIDKEKEESGKEASHTTGSPRGGGSNENPA